MNILDKKNGCSVIILDEKDIESAIMQFICDCIPQYKKGYVITTDIQPQEVLSLQFNDNKNKAFCKNCNTLWNEDELFENFNENELCCPTCKIHTEIEFFKKGHEKCKHVNTTSAGGLIHCNDCGEDIVY